MENPAPLPADPPTSPPIARLVAEMGPVAPLELILERPRIQIGRSTDNDLVIEDTEISRRHAQLLAQEQGYAVQDLDSTNGTFINGLAVRELTPLRHGDRLEFADTAMVRYFEDRLAPAGSDALADANGVRADRRNRWVVGCAIGLLLLCLCGVVTLFALDAYAQGRVLYCGGLRPFWELLLGPFGFNPVCP